MAQLKTIAGLSRFVSPKIWRRGFSFSWRVQSIIQYCRASRRAPKQKGKSHDPSADARACKNSADYLMLCHLSEYLYSSWAARIYPWVGKHLNETWSTEISLKVCTNESDENRRRRDRFRCRFFFSHLRGAAIATSTTGRKWHINHMVLRLSPGRRWIRHVLHK